MVPLLPVPATRPPTKTVHDARLPGSADRRCSRPRPTHQSSASRPPRRRRKTRCSRRWRGSGTPARCHRTWSGRARRRTGSSLGEATWKRQGDRVGGRKAANARARAPPRQGAARTPRPAPCAAFPTQRSVRRSSGPHSLRAYLPRPRSCAGRCPCARGSGGPCAALGWTGPRMPGA